MTVTWPANPDAESFHVRAETSGGAFLSCDSTSTSCSISGLPCGQSYSVTVTSVRGGCESQPSTAVNVTSGNLHNNAQLPAVHRYIKLFKDSKWKIAVIKLAIFLHNLLWNLKLFTTHWKGREILKLQYHRVYSNCPNNHYFIGCQNNPLLQPKCRESQKMLSKCNATVID